MNDEWQLLKVCHSRGEKEVIVSLLKSHQIEYFVPDEHTSSLYGSSPNPIGGEKIYVKKKDFAEALKLINSTPQK